MSLCELSKVGFWLWPFSATWDNDHLPRTILSKLYGWTHHSSILHSPSGLCHQLLCSQIALHAFMMCIRTHVTSTPFYSLLWWVLRQSLILFWTLWTEKEQNNSHVWGLRDTTRGPEEIQGQVLWNAVGC